MIQQWVDRRDSGTPRRDGSRGTLSWEQNGWIGFDMSCSLGDYEQLEDLGFLTPPGIDAVRHVCGENTTTFMLAVNIVARGPLWLPKIVLGIEGDATTEKIYHSFKQMLCRCCCVSEATSCAPSEESV